jgi:hypothetical protein
MAATFVVGLLVGALIFRRPPGSGDVARPVLPAVTSPCPEVRPVEAVPVVVPTAPRDAAPQVDVATAAPTDRTAEPQSGCVVHFESSPPSALVAVDGIEVGKAPVKVERACGQPVQVQVSAPRFAIWQKKITPTHDGPKRVLASLARPRTRLAVVSNPPGATVTIGARVAGRTPTTVDVAAFSVTSVKVTLSGYKPFETTVTPKLGAPQQVKATLVKLGNSVPAKPAVAPKKSVAPAPKVVPKTTPKTAPKTAPPPARKPRF